MKRTLLLFLLTFCCFIYSNAQEWEQIYALDDVAGFPSSSLAYDVQATPDGGYILAGVAEAISGAIRRYIRLVKTDAEGNLEWSKIFKEGQIISEEARSVAVLSDGGYLLGGSSAYSSSSNNSLMYLLKTDASGTEQWIKNDFEGMEPEQQYGDAVLQANDDHLLLVGTIQNVSNGHWDIFLAKTDLDGNVIWYQRYFKESNIFLRASNLIEANNGDLIISGSILSKGLLLRTNAMGDSLWTESYIQSKGSSVLDLVETPSGDLVLGTFQSGFAGVNPDVLKTNADGVEEVNWFQSFGGTGTTFWGMVEAIDQTEEGTFVMTGFSSGAPPLGSGVGYLAKVAEEGNVLWTRTLSDIYNAKGRAILALEGDCYVIAGEANGHMYLTKLCGEGTNQTKAIPENQKKLAVYPNPNTGWLNLSLEEASVANPLQFRLFNTLGQMVVEKSIRQQNSTIKTAHLPTGTYWYDLRLEGQSTEVLQIGKLVIK